MMNQFQSEHLAAQHRQQLESEADSARLAQEAATDAPDTTHSILDVLGSRVLAVGRFLAAPVLRRRTQPGDAPISL
jgi:hypothetical protein